MKTNVYGISLIILLFAPFIALYIRMQNETALMKEHVRSYILPEISKEEKCILKFSIQESHTLLRWEKPDEFEYKTEMYDVIKTEFGKDSVTYVCYHDTKESHLKESYARLLNASLGSDSDKKKQQNQIQLFFNIMYLPAGISETPANSESTAHNGSNTRKLFTECKQKPPVPPPQSD